ncbi:MAG: YidC/Oxa1 family insertase periplasmic-domain containing protein [Holophagaceae bacterium]|nr:YidC/Oxa1 family insertase periplasmic-domain containing protein [Holophagaceae bacterium]
MNNRNLLIFVILSAALLGGNALLMNKLYPPKPAPAPATAPASASAKAEGPATSSAVKAPEAAHTPARESTPSAPATAVPPPSQLAPVILANRELKLTFKPQDGTLLQAEWVTDGTRFFNETVRDDKAKEDTSRPFPGIGGVAGAVFDGAEILEAGERPVVRFQNAAGDRLEYRLDGHNVLVQLESKQPIALRLLPFPKDEKEVNHMGRVFSLDDQGIKAVVWMDMIKDPFFSFVGAKRKELPPANVKVGMDAGLEKAASSQRAHYFAALWDLPRAAERSGEGFLLRTEQGKASARLYLGPKQPEFLSAFGPAFTRVQDFGFFGSVAKFLFWVLRAIHRAVGNWGWAILIFTVVLRLALWPLNTKMVVSQLRMKDLEPHQKALQAKYEKFGNDMAKKAEMQKELMAFYKKNGHNPMGGCLPMLLQMPVFLALWSMLTNVFELRQAPFALWIHDLSAKDPFYVLPVLLGASMVAQSALAPPMGDPQQRKMMMVLMPAMMVFFFAQSPAGLALYYLMFNLIGLLQTWWVRRNHQPLPVVV